jgi:hypothetical protein
LQMGARLSASRAKRGKKQRADENDYPAIHTSNDAAGCRISRNILRASARELMPERSPRVSAWRSWRCQ